MKRRLETLIFIIALLRGETMIEVKNITKDFKKNIKDPGLKGSIKALFRPKSEIIHAVDDVSFQLDKGEILGFIGPNGAGKSTCIKMLTGILTPTSGMCEIDGIVPYENRKAYVKDIGVVFGQRTQLWWDLPLSETYTVLKEIYEVPDQQFRRQMAFLNEVLELDGFIKNPVRTLSLGQRMRADIAASMLHSPKVLFLDEPTIGLDVVVKDNIRKAIKKINQEEQTTVILTTHDLSDIEMLCKNIVIIDKGKKVYDESLDHLKRNYGQFRELQFEMQEDIKVEDIKFLEQFHASGNEISITQEKLNVNVRFNSDTIPIGEILEYTLSKVKVKDISVKDTDIEDIIRRLYKREMKVDG